jgi:hypothetical protein
LNRKAKMALIFSTICLAGVAASYSLFTLVYGSAEPLTTTQVVTIENGGQRLRVDNLEYDVMGSELVENGGSSFYRLQIGVRESNVMRESSNGKGCETPPAEITGGSPAANFIEVPSDLYELARSGGGSVTFSSRTTTEPRTVDFLPIAAGIGVLLGALAVVVSGWFQRSWGDAAAVLVEHGFHDMTVREVEIVGHMMEKKEFTVPELMKLTKASKITVWRTVQKLMERGLVAKTEKTKMASGGLGGRGKPSIVYRFTGGGTDAGES